jgi:hypothetical protein
VNNADQLPTIISIISVVIAFAAFITSWRAQRANYKLQLQVSSQAGRLQAVTSLSRKKLENKGSGFKALNGPNELTLTNANLRITYTLHRTNAAFWGEEIFTFSVSSDEFGVLGMSGPEFNFRLAPYDEVEWRLPLSVSWSLPKLSDSKGNLSQEIKLGFSLTAAGETKEADQYVIGGWDWKPIFGYRKRRGAEAGLGKTILGILVNDTTGIMPDAKSPIEIPEMRRELGLDFEMPAGLQNWLVSAWGQAGRFQDEQTEEFARELLRLRAAITGAS